MLMKLGFIDNQNVQLALKHQQINEIRANRIDHNKITSTMNLQRSRYVVIDDEVKRL